MALALPTLTTTITGAIPPDQAGVAGGLQATTRELGSALGVAVIGTIGNAQFAHRLGERLGSVDGHTPRTVAGALRRFPAHHDAVVSSYVAGAGAAPKAVAVVIVCAGGVLIGEARLAARSRVAGANAPAGTASGSVDVEIGER
jgi:hypothetical protein